MHPGDTFVALAALVTFYPVFRGTLDLIVALSAGGVMPGRWPLVIIGLGEVLLGFWTAGSLNRPGRGSVA